MANQGLSIEDKVHAAQARVERRRTQHEVPDTGRNSSALPYFDRSSNTQYQGAVRAKEPILDRLTSMFQNATFRKAVGGATLAAIVFTAGKSVLPLISSDADNQERVTAQSSYSDNALAQARTVLENAESGAEEVDPATYDRALEVVTEFADRQDTINKALSQPCDRGSANGVYVAPTCFKI